MCLCLWLLGTVLCESTGVFGSSSQPGRRGRGKQAGRGAAEQGRCVCVNKGKAWEAALRAGTSGLRQALRLPLPLTLATHTATQTATHTAVLGRAAATA